MNEEHNEIENPHISIEQIRPKINIETGYFEGRKLYDETGKRHYSDCSIAAISNYLLALGFNPETINSFQSNFIANQKFDRSTGIFPTIWIPKAIEEASLGRLKVKLWLHQTNMEDIPEDLKDSVDFVPDGFIVNTAPLLAIGQIGNDISHLFVVNESNGEQYIIDNDGKKHDISEYVLNGYVDIKGVENFQKSTLTISENVLRLIKKQFTNKSIIQ